MLGLCVTAAKAADLVPLEISAGGVTRTALVYAPPQARTAPSPLVFVFHGHGGWAEQAARSFHIERDWPEAIVVYPQGLKTPGLLSDPEGARAGWQLKPGGQDDRDLNFFDALLARLRQDFKVDASRIYATGHSNGGGFVYLLWLTRGDAFAAVAPSAAAAVYARQLPAKPALILGGRDDPLVKFSWQEMTMNAVRKVNGCGASGQPWEKVCTLYPSPTGTPLVTYVFDGGHQFTPAEPPLIAKFFQGHRRR